MAAAGTWRPALRAAEREQRVTLRATDICGRRLCRSSEEITRIAILLTPRRAAAGARRAFHGTFTTGCYVRGTVGMDLWVDQAGDNPDRLVAAIREFGFSSADLTPDHFHKDAQIIRMGVPPLRIELMTSVSGVGFDECYDQREIVNREGLPVSMISLDMLKRNKQAASRQKDLNDLDQLD